MPKKSKKDKKNLLSILLVDYPELAMSLLKTEDGEEIFLQLAEGGGGRKGKIQKKNDSKKLEDILKVLYDEGEDEEDEDENEEEENENEEEVDIVDLLLKAGIAKKKDDPWNPLKNIIPGGSKTENPWAKGSRDPKKQMEIYKKDPKLAKKMMEQAKKG